MVGLAKETQQRHEGDLRFPYKKTPKNQKKTPKKINTHLT
tara:strand:- start:255 stop:374 length:120 start_codon:yes stop_codon:yes gene_type:complete